MQLLQLFLKLLVRAANEAVGSKHGVCDFAKVIETRDHVL